MPLSVLREIPPTDGRGISSSMLDTVGPVSVARPNAGKLAVAAAVAMPALVADAKVAHDGLLEALARTDVALARREKLVKDAVLQEKEVDRSVGAHSPPFAA